jgi:hypothetical protein
LSTKKEFEDDKGGYENIDTMGLGNVRVMK